MSQKCAVTPPGRFRNLSLAFRNHSHGCAYSGNRTLGSRPAPYGPVASGVYNSDGGLLFHSSEGVLALQSDDAVGAEASFRKALRIAISVFGVLSVEAATCQRDLAQALSAQCKYEQAELFFTTAIAIVQALRRRVAADAEHESEREDLDGVLQDAAREYAKMKDARRTAAAPAAGAASDVPPVEPAAS